MTLLSRAVLAVLLAALACLPWTAREARADAEQEVAAVIEYLRQKDPEIVLKAVQAWWDEQEEYRRQRQVGRIAANWEALARAEGDPAIGPEDADAVLVEFFDYRCGYCRRVKPTLETLLTENDDLRLAFKEFPILGPESTLAARAALAARAQGLYEPFHWALMGTDGAFDLDHILGVARSVGLDADRLVRDMDDPAIDGLIERNAVLANVLAIRGTPAFVIGDRMIRGALPIAAFRTAIADAREALQ